MTDIPTGNHDLPRISYQRTKQELEVAYAFLLTMPGVPFVYYGDEIGMPYRDDLPSKEGGFNRTGRADRWEMDAAAYTLIDTNQTDVCCAAALEMPPFSYFIWKKK